MSATSGDLGMHWLKLSVFTLPLFLSTIPHQRVYSQRKDLAYDLWLVRSQTLTAELIKDGDNLETSQRSILLAKLAQEWWRDNPEKKKNKSRGGGRKQRGGGNTKEQA